jgi:4-hydroxy-tetrahydrodipicolinate reductase
MMRFAELAAPYFPVAEIIELHHDRKTDAPSGTALNTAARIGAAQPDQQRAGVSQAASGVLGVDVDGVRIHSVRLPGIVANQEVIFGGAGQTLTIRHDTTDRSAFGPGIELAVRRVGSLTDPVTLGLDALL